MAKLIPIITTSKITNQDVVYAYRFLCPGCGDTHCIPVVKIGYKKENGKEECIWGFNWNINAPTFTPSILVRSGHFSEHWKGPKCWCTYRREYHIALAIREGRDREPPNCYICHSFVKEGYIQFLSDCTHKLANQTVLLPEADPNKWRSL